MTSQISQCYCGNNIAFAACCQPLVLGKQLATSPEALMRSRFCAYVVQNYAYILATYGPQQSNNLSLNTIAEGANNTRWLRLDVFKSTQKSSAGTVEFSAYYQVDQQFYVMHETSEFIKQNGQWYYTRGSMHKDSGPYTQQRNAQCLCGSGNKYKKCCANLAK